METNNYSIDKYLKEKSLESLVEFSDDMYRGYFSEEYTLKDINISSRVLLNWYNNGLLPDKVKERRNHRFSFVELVWLNIVKELRDFGFSIDKIKNVKESLMAEIDLAELIGEFSQEQFAEAFIEEFKDEIPDENKKEASEFFQSSECMEDIKGKKVPILFFIISNSVYMKENVQFMIDVEGNVISYNHMNLEADEINEIEQNSYIVIPLMKILKKFVSDPDNLKAVSNAKLLNENELHIMSLIREGKAKSVTIKFKNRKPVMMEIDEERKIENGTKLSEIMLKKGYEELQVNTQNGCITYSNIKTKVKFD